jgi:hypothetical protein
MVGFFLASMTNSLTAVCVLGRHGHGADAIRVGRGMFEILVSLKYLIARPAEVRDYLDFDWVARWKRLQYYKATRPTDYAGFPASKKEMVEREYARIRKRFVGANGKLRTTWCKHPIAQMAATAGLNELYDVFYPYASSIHHANPMGLGMLLEGDSLEVRPAPQLPHIGIALMLAIRVLAEAIRSYTKLHEADFEETLGVVEEGAMQGSYDAGSVVGSLAEIFPDGS